MRPQATFSASVEKGNSFFIVVSNAMPIFLKGINFPTQKRLKQGVLN